MGDCEVHHFIKDEDQGHWRRRTTVWVGALPWFPLLHVLSSYR